MDDYKGGQLWMISIAYRVRRLCSLTEQSTCAWQELKQHLKLRKAKIASVPTQISSRFEDQLAALKSRGYKERAVLYQFQLVLLRSREEVMEKVVRPEDDKAIILALPFDRRLPDAASILHQHYNLLVQRNPGVKEWMVRAPMVAHLRPANLRDFLVRAKLPQVNRRGEVHVEEINQGLRSVERLVACAASTPPTQGRTPAP